MEIDTAVGGFGDEDQHRRRRHCRGAPDNNYAGNIAIPCIHDVFAKEGRREPRSNRKSENSRAPSRRRGRISRQFRGFRFRGKVLFLEIRENILSSKFMKDSSRNSLKRFFSSNITKILLFEIREKFFSPKFVKNSFPRNS